MVRSEGLVGMVFGRSSQALKRVLPCAWAVCLSFCAAYAVDAPWADAVVARNAIAPLAGFTDPSKTLGAPAGGGVLAPNNGKAYCIGTPGAAPGSYITLKFDTPILNDPNNPLGLDFVVHGNAFWVGGVPTRRWAEAALVEVSADTNGNGLADDPWYVIPGSRGLDAAVLPSGIANPSPALAGNVLNAKTDGTEQDWGYADMSPTVQPYRDNYLRPDDPLKVGLTARSGGGDAFDLSWAVGPNATPAALDKADFVRISAFINGTVSGFGTVAPEISAVVDIDPLTDTDGDGVIDAYETRVAGTDPLRPESTVLPLETPAEYGGSPAGTELGRASDAAGNALALFSSGQRTGVRAYNCTVDLASATLPGVPLPGLTASGAMRTFSADIADFAAAQVAPPQLTLAYTAGHIAGLDEALLSPWRFDGTQWTQAGISTVERDPSLNRVSFRSTSLGLFVLASVPGAGDQDVSAVAVSLHADPAGGSPADGLSVVQFASNAILDGGSPVADGTLLTVSIEPSGLATLLAADADGMSEGVQIPVAGDIVSFSLRTGTTAGLATIRVRSLDGRISGECRYPLFAGPPALSTALWLQNAQATAPGPIYLYTGELRDAFGNPVADGALVTIECLGAVPVNMPDADPSLPGYQVRTLSGIASFAVATAGGSGNTRGMRVSVLSGDTVLAEEEYELPYAAVPGPGPLPVALVLLCAAAAVLRRRRCPGSAPRP